MLLSYLGLMFLEVCPDILLPGGWQLGPGEPGHPGRAEVGKHAGRSAHPDLQPLLLFMLTQLGI